MINLYIVNKKKCVIIYAEMVLQYKCQAMGLNVLQPRDNILLWVFQNHRKKKRLLHVAGWHESQL